MSQLNVALRNNSKYFNLIPYEDLSDERTQNWMLVSSFSSVLAWVSIYLLMVWNLPKLMLRHKPMKLRLLLIFYNLSLALLNAYIFKELLSGALHANYNFLCQPCRVIYSRTEIQIASAIWWYYFSKLLEFLDTLFFILRKKPEQLTFLHVYHHSTMFPLWWIAIKWVPTGSSFFPAMINSFIHVIMYSYYGLSAFGPQMRKYLWWKKYITLLQLIQFAIGLLWAVQSILRSCEFPKWISYVTIFYMTTFLILFGRFYVKSYRDQRPQGIQKTMYKKSK